MSNQHERTNNATNGDSEIPDLAKSAQPREFSYIDGMADTYGLIHEVAHRLMDSTYDVLDIWQETNQNQAAIDTLQVIPVLLEKMLLRFDDFYFEKLDNYKRENVH